MEALHLPALFQMDTSFQHSALLNKKIELLSKTLKSFYQDFVLSK